MNVCIIIISSSNTENFGKIGPVFYERKKKKKKIKVFENNEYIRGPRVVRGYREGSLSGGSGIRKSNPSVGSMDKVPAVDLGQVPRSWWSAVILQAMYCGGKRVKFYQLGIIDGGLNTV